MMMRMMMRMGMRMMEDIFSSYCKYLSANADPCTADNSITHHTFHINIPPEHKYFRPPFYTGGILPSTAHYYTGSHRIYMT